MGEIVWGTLLLVLVGIALLGPLVVQDPFTQQLAVSYSPPFGFDGAVAGHVFGTDQLGRDVFARTVYGLRSSMATGFLAVSLAAVVGVAIGIVCGYFGGWFDFVVMRFVDIHLSIPGIVLLLLAVAILNPSFWTVVIVLALLSVVVFIRVARAEVLALKGQEMMLALIALGATPSRQIFRHIFPNVSGPLIILITIEFSHAVIAGAALSYLGMGVPPPEPTLGGMISDAQGGITAGLWWPLVAPGGVLVVLVMAVNRLGEGTRALLDPRQKVRRTSKKDDYVVRDG